jgi:hypothetical protein
VDFQTNSEISKAILSKTKIWLLTKKLKSKTKGDFVGRILTITGSRETSVGVKKRAIKKEIKIGSTAIKFISIAIFAILAIVYLTQSTAGANRSIEIRDLTSKSTDLELQKEQLEVEKARLNSLNQIDANIEKQPMTPVTSVDYLNEANRAVALR